MRSWRARWLPQRNDLRQFQAYKSLTQANFISYIRQPRADIGAGLSYVRGVKGFQISSWITRPERSFGSNQVVLGGMMLPVSAMSIN